MKQVNYYSEEVPGFNLPRKSWIILNRIRTGQGRCNHLLHKWGYKSDASCSCGAREQTIAHILNDCPERRFPGGLDVIHKCCPEAIKWLNDLDVQL